MATSYLSSFLVHRFSFVLESGSSQAISQAVRYSINITKDGKNNKGINHVSIFGILFAFDKRPTKKQVIYELPEYPDY